MVRSFRIGNRRYLLAPGINSVGRDPRSVVYINDASVSRHHARITIAGERATLEDLNSKNGTTVMGTPIAHATELNDGDEIEFGQVKGWYIVEAGDDPPTTTHL
ncbi:MAG TPA: FHA domain-containing protein [Vicinamibacterales bacterium]|nr:FHA domain-containing protein [Vicinamibacterales bacterium]